MFKFLRKSEFIDAYTKFYPFVKKYLFLAVIGILLTIPVGALDAVIAWFLKPFMDNVMVDKQEEFSSYVPYIIVGFTVIQGIFIYLASWVNTYVGQKVTHQIRKKLYDKLLTMDCSYYDSQNSGMIIMRYFNDADLASNGLINNFKLFLTKFFSSLSLIFVLIWNSWELSLIAIGVIVFLFIPMSIVRKKIQYIMTKTLMVGTFIVTLYNETFSGNKILKSYTLNDKMRAKFDEASNFVCNFAIKLVTDTNWLSPVMHAVASIGVAIVIAVGGHLIVTGAITSGTFVSFLAALIMLYTPLKSIGNNYIDVQKSIIALGRIYEILETKTFEEKEEEKNLPPMPPLKESIEFRNLYFKYSRGQDVLKGINFTINQGQTVALVGNSGGGKSTIASLIPRLYDWYKGDIFLDGKSIRDYDLTSLRKQISYVFQDNFLFMGTLRENIILGKEHATEEEIKAAVKNACLDEFVKNLPQGLETEIGERGILLSGGQKQRVAIARAFIKNAPIVILDEATSALDNRSEKVVQEALNNLMQNRTVIIIAHRLSTIQNANKILVIQDGVIAEEGNHHTLLAKGGFYANLYNTKELSQNKLNIL